MFAKKGRYVWGAGIFLLLLCACTPDRYALDKDVAPDGHFDASVVADVTPKYEPLSRSGNQSPYKVNGKEYRINFDTAGYKVRGIASWYGQKFHGYHTANGEIYSMYELTAAHKTLPLPTFLRVTNLQNQKSIVVRVNDRGPFHSDRILDLSYAAAIKLGYMAQGTAEVEIEVITPADSPVFSVARENKASLAVDASLVPGHAYFVQQAAYTDIRLLQANAQTLQGKIALPLAVNRGEVGGKPVFRLWIGPYYQKLQAEKAILQLEAMSLPAGLLITRPLEVSQPFAVFVESVKEAN